REVKQLQVTGPLAFHQPDVQLRNGQCVLKKRQTNRPRPLRTGQSGMHQPGTRHVKAVDMTRRPGPHSTYDPWQAGNQLPLDERDEHLAASANADIWEVEPLQLPAGGQPDPSQGVQYGLVPVRDAALQLDQAPSRDVAPPHESASGLSRGVVCELAAGPRLDQAKRTRHRHAKGTANGTRPRLIPPLLAGRPRPLESCRRAGLAAPPRPHRGPLRSAGGTAPAPPPPGRSAPAAARSEPSPAALPAPRPTASSPPGRHPGPASRPLPGTA